MRRGHLICIVFLAAALCFLGFSGKALATSMSNTSFGLSLGSYDNSLQFDTTRTVTHGSYQHYAGEEMPAPLLVSQGPKHRPGHHPKYDHRRPGPNPHHGYRHNGPRHDPRHNPGPAPRRIHRHHR